MRRLAVYCVLVVVAFAAGGAVWRCVGGQGVNLPQLRMAGGDAQPPMGPYRVQHGVVFRELLPDLPVDIFCPRHPNRVPVLFVQSGGWRQWTKPEPEKLLRPLIDAGYTVFAFRHREQEGDTLRDLVADIRAAARFVQFRGRDYGAEPKRLVLFGISAGGHLALLTARSVGAAGVVAWAPPTDLRTIGKPEIARFGSTEDPALSPVLNVEGVPPVLLVHGSGDQFIPLEQSRAYARAVGPDCSLVVLQCDHSFSAALPQAWSASIDWLDRLGRMP